MTHAHTIRFHAALWAVLGIACLAPAPVLAQRGVDKGCSPTLANPCTGGSAGGGSTGGGDSIGTTLGTAIGKALGEALFGGGSSDQTKSRQEVALALNKQGIEAYNKGDWDTAIAYFDQAVRNSPDDAVIRQNLTNAYNARTNKAALQTREREATERQRQNKAAADNMQQSIHDFAQTLNAAPLSGGLDFDGRNPGSTPGGSSNSGGLDFTSAIAPSAKGAPPAVGKNANQAKSTAYSEGFEHASQCISQNAGSSCAGVTADQQQSCVADYRAGYDSGSIQKKLVLQEAYQAGHDAATRGELANGASDQHAEGPCRTDWIMAYNNGHFRAKAPRK